MAGFAATRCPSFRRASLSLSFNSSNPNPFLLTQVEFPSRRSTFPKIYAITTVDIKVGVSIELDGDPWKVIEFFHVKPRKGAAYVRTSLRNYLTQETVEKIFRAGGEMEELDIYKETKQFNCIRRDGFFVFLDLTTLEKYRLHSKYVGDKVKWLKEGMDCIFLFWNRKVIDFELPITTKLKVVKVDTGLIGDTARDATVETGAVVSVPLFINIGEEILIDTRNGKYMGRT